ncbi:CD82 antigen [Xyrichtys novacula]|uniref:CD82 antigen n=1 Tax=Xyrichtys novacula TaxID=13765 RepID=A0AAV1FKT3_XYRNO|nr:CD82 antigen [Xyrichtys novacula]
MKLEVKVQVLKFFSVVLNLVFLALGLSLFFCAVWVLFDKWNLLTVLPSDELQTVGAGLFLIGAVVGVVSLVGFLAIAKENRLLLLVYLGFFIVLVLGQLFVTLLLLLHRSTGVCVCGCVPEVSDGVASSQSQRRLSWSGYTGSDLHEVQHYDQFFSLIFVSINNRTVKSSAVNKTFEFQITKKVDATLQDMIMNYKGDGDSRDTLMDRIQHYGCKGRVEDWVHQNLLTITVMGFSLIFIQVIQLALAASLYNTIGRKNNWKNSPPVDADHAPLNHTLEDHLTNGEHNYGYTDYNDGYTDPAHPGHLHDYPEPVYDLHFITNNQQ